MQSPTPRTYLHPQLLSPDPTIGQSPTAGDKPWYGMSLYPHAVAWAARWDPPLRAWANTLHLHRAPGPLELVVPPGDDADLLLDFGTECEGAFTLEILTLDSGSIAISYGESPWEAREWNLPSICPDQRPRKSHWTVPGPGSHTHRGEPGGFRYVRIRAVDFAQPVTIRRVAVDARFMFPQALGSFNCSDPLFQRIYQSSVYTARLCARPDSFWDGIKRDRHGWYGDARITKSTVDAVYLDPAPSLAMMALLPPQGWVNAIPNFSFDCLAMLAAHVLTFGLGDPALKDIYAKVAAFMKWVLTTQVNEDGLIVRRDGVDYFFGIGFTDWSPQPLGGRLEELGCLQFAWLEALNTAARLADWFGDTAGAADYRQRAAHLSSLLHQRFWQPEVGFHHTLNLAEPPATPWRMPLAFGEHYRKTYEDQLRLGPSGPSLQSSARAVFAGLCRPAESPVLVRVLADGHLPPIITSYYQYYANAARAQCGDVDGAIHALRGYFGPMLLDHDSATIWESYEPHVRGIRAWSLGGWPKSLCHGWGSGTVAITHRYLLGIIPQSPGMAEVRLDPRCRLPWTFTATVPTPLGPIEVEKPDPAGPVHYRVPRGMVVKAGEGVKVSRE